LLASLIEAWGGQDLLAACLYTEFKSAQPGSMVRQRILELICRMISQHSDAEPPVPLDDLDDDALRSAIVNLTRPLAEKVGVQNAQKAATATPGSA
jgi:hypothetical protein